jgi:HEAT repeat protein
MKTLLRCAISSSQMSSPPVLRVAGLILLLAAVGCGRRGAASPQPQFTPEQIRELVNCLTSKNSDTGMGFDLRVAAADRLAEVGPPAKEYGAVAPLENLLKNKDPKIRHAAQTALAKINGQ